MASGILASASHALADPCSYTVTPTTVNAAASGGNGTLSVTTDATCTWTATSDSPWVTFGDASGYPTQVVADGALGYWRLDETTGSTAADASGHGLTATYYGGVTLNQPGALVGTDGAAQFDGSTGYVWAGYVANVTNQFTLEAWVKTSAGQYQSILKKFGGGGYFLHLLATGQVRFGWYAANDLFYDIRTTASYNDGAWHHLVGTFDGTTGRIYVDGVQQASQAATAGPAVSTVALTIGGQDDQATAGTIDEVAIYASALSATQVTTHYSYRANATSVGSGSVAYTVASNPNPTSREDSGAVVSFTTTQ